MNAFYLVWIVCLAFLDFALGECRGKCLAKTCDEHISAQPVFTCAKLESFDCDCSGCMCDPTKIPATTTRTYKFQWYEQKGYICMGRLDDSLAIGKGGMAYDYLTPGGVEQCKAKCAQHIRCQGFNYEGEICRYKRRIDTEHLVPKTGAGCYVYARHSVVPLTLPPTEKTTVASTCVNHNGCVGLSCDDQIRKNPNLKCMQLERDYCDCAGCLCEQGLGFAPKATTTAVRSTRPPRRTRYPTPVRRTRPPETTPIRTRRWDWRTTVPTRTMRPETSWPRPTTTLRGSVKKCRDVVCGGQSHCIDQADGFECYCAKGWIGGGRNKLCENVNECAGVTCGGSQSKCVDGINLYECLCAEGYTGGGINAVCTANVCKCSHGVAGTGSSCPKNGAAKCVSCNHGYDLQMDDTCVDLCASQSCNGHGSCYAGKCYCKDGYTGTFCRGAPDPCATAHCGDHGRCFGGDCFCEDFYTGNHCQIPPGHGSPGGVVVVHGRQ